MIDLHCHILPGIDDGPKTIEESLALARAAAELGTSTIVATSHVSREYRNDAATIASSTAALRARIGDEGLTLDLRPGAEIAMTTVADMAPEELSKLALGGGRWLLIECPFTTLATGFDLLLMRLQSQGRRIVLAHPERSPIFHHDPKLLGALVRSGVLTSITASSLVGRFGGEVRRFALRLVHEELVHNVASDAHNLASRPPGMGRELHAAGLDPLADWLTCAVPAAILAGEDIPSRPAVAVTGPIAGRAWWRRRAKTQR